jgi:hypothetical protein
MLFLIEYDRNRGEIVLMREFESFERENADRARLELELDLNRQGIEHEVVVLEAFTEDALRRTHRRYFEDLSQLIEVS